MAMQQPKLEVSAEKKATAAATATVSATAVAGGGVAVTARRQIPQGMGGQAWVGQEPRADGPRIAFIVTTSDSLQQIRVWINYHRSIGVGTFYIFADGQVSAGAGRLASHQSRAGVGSVTPQMFLHCCSDLHETRSRVTPYLGRPAYCLPCHPRCRAAGGTPRQRRRPACYPWRHRGAA